MKKRITNFWQNELQALFRYHALFLLIAFAGIALRVYQLDSHMIFFGDIGRDFQAAKQMIETKEIPLLGIPSSVPRFRQGPVTIWYIAGIFLVSDYDPVIVGTMFALLSILVMVALYLFLRETVSATVALVATTIFAFSPLAIAHARMPYHTTPIPLFTVLFLYCMYRLWNAPTDHKNLFFAGLSWAVLFQFELAVAPLLFVIPYVLYRKKQYTKKIIPKSVAVIGGIGLGVLPQILHDLTNRFEHLGGFAIWVAYRLTAFAGYGGEHTVGLGRIANTVNIFKSYFVKMVSIEQGVLALFFLILLISSIFFLYKNRKTLPVTIEITAITTLILTIAYFIHGTPSEAYFPPYFILVPILLGYGFSQLSAITKTATASILILWVILTPIRIVQNNFFTTPTDSTFHYGPSYGEQVRVMQFITTQSGERSYKLYSTDEGNHFPAFLDHYRFLGWRLGKAESDDLSDHVFFIQLNNRDVLSYPGSRVIPFDQITVVQLR